MQAATVTLKILEEYSVFPGKSAPWPIHPSLVCVGLDILPGLAGSRKGSGVIDGEEVGRLWGS